MFVSMNTNTFLKNSDQDFLVVEISSKKNLIMSTLNNILCVSIIYFKMERYKIYNIIL